MLLELFTLDADDGLFLRAPSAKSSFGRFRVITGIGAFPASRFLSESGAVSSDREFTGEIAIAK